jgi:ferrochelatase
MCYGNPTVKTALDSFVEHGCTRVLSLPLFPQTAYCTTLACTDRVDEAAKGYPELMVEHILDYGTDPLYLNAMEASIRGRWDHHIGSRLLFSFHSAPLINMRRGDTYDVQAMATCKAIAGRLGLHDDEWALGFHSRFDDSRKWLGPNPKKILARWAKEGVEDVAVVCPGFSVDCLETLVDCGIEQRAVFEEGVRAAGGKPRFTLIPALNDREDHIACLAHLVIEHLS